MLEKLRRGATKVLVFALFAVLILSFAIWGIGDVVRQARQGSIAEVGGTEISPQEFISALQQRRQLIARQLGQPITAEQSRAFGIDAAVLGELVNGAAVANYARDLGLRLSDQTLAEQIRSDPAFHGPDKTFSRAVFDERLRQAGFSEQSYFAERRRNEIREQLTEALVAGLKAPDTLADIVYRFREETRSVRYIQLDPDKVPAAGEPDEKSLKSLYEQQKSAFTVPERRKVSVLLVTPQELKARSSVTDEEVRKSWEEARQSWDVPERRRIQQISYKTKEEAEGEKKAIEAGKSFLIAALEADGAHGRLDQGLIARREISDPTFAKVAFELPLNKVSDPVKVRGGWLLLRVSEIAPAQTRTFDEVKGEVRKSLEEAKSRELINKLHDEIEDKRGATDKPDKLKAIADELKLKLLVAPSVDAKGLNPDGKPAFDHPDAQRFVTSAFEGDALTPRDPITLSDGGEAWVEVSDVRPAVTKPFEEVKADVEKLWREREKRAALTKRAQELVDKIKAGTALEEIAKESNLEVKTTPPFKRSSPPDGLTQAATHLAFTLPKGGAASSASADGKTRIVMVVDDIKAAPEPTKEQLDAIRKELSQELQRDTLQTYVGAVRERQGVKINEDVYKRTVGLEQAP
ncbi:MAG: SurA N-terminal domain-containing protein [Hyphomicrobiaceae bacterium]